ncbi:MAG TPA: peptidoglycan-binding domain-containing protein [Terriglobales bacterium]
MFNYRAKDFLALISLFFLAAMVCGAQGTTPPAKKSPSHTASSSAKRKKSTHGKSGKKTSSTKHGQQKIDPQRAREIQQALIREHYLTGEPTGTWDDQTQQAMQKFQADNGWQDKTTPDSRALIKLGLGPDHDHLLNPESAMTAPHAQAISPTPASTNQAASKSPQ